MATISSNNYTVGAVDMFFEASVAHASLLATDPDVASGLGGSFRTTARDFGNVVSAEIAPDVTYIEHFISDKGMRKKDKMAANVVSLTMPFTFDEINEANLKRYFLASDLTAQGSKLAPFERPLIEGAAQLVFNTDVGNDMVYFVPKCTIRPDGNLTANTEDWWSAPMVLEILHYDTGHWASKPFGMLLASNLT